MERFQQAYYSMCKVLERFTRNWKKIIRNRTQKFQSFSMTCLSIYLPFYIQFFSHKIWSWKSEIEVSHPTNLKKEYNNRIELRTHFLH